MSVDGTVFYFRAGTPGGDVFAGELRAGSSEDALQQLRRKGFRPLRLETRPIRANWLNREVSFGSARRLTLADCQSFCGELSLLLRSGVPIAEALAVMLAALPKRSRLHGFVASVRHAIQLGRPLSGALDGAGYRLPPDLVPLLQAGEGSGTLVAALDMVAISYAEANRFRRAYVAAAAYPILLLAVSGVVFGLLALFVAPSLVGLFSAMNRPVPLALAALSAVGSFLTGNGAAIGISFAALLVVAFTGGTAAVVRGSAQRCLAAIPIMGSALNWAATRRFVTTLRLHLLGHVSLATALPSAFAAASFAGGEARAAAVVTRVRAGAALSPELRASRLLPDKIVHLIEVGETGGRLAEVLEAIAGEATARFEQRMSLVTSLLAPALILVVGTMIGGVIFSVFSALLEINEIAF